LKDVEVYRGLLEEFIGKMIRPEAGQFRIEITTLRIILDRSSRKDPLLMKVSLNDNGRLTCDLPDNEDSLLALKVYLQKSTDFISSLIGEEVARDLIAEYISENESYISENVITRPVVVESLPEPFKELVTQLEQRSGGGSDHAEILHLFTEVFNAYLRDLSKFTDLSAFKLKLGILREQHVLLRSMNLRKNNTIEIDAPVWANATESDVGGALTSAFNSLVALSSFLMGKEEATRKGVQALRENFDGREDLLSRYVPLDNLMEGALRQKVSTGIHLLDKRMKGGLPKGASILLLAPGGIERDLFMARMFSIGVAQGGSLIYVTSRDPPRSFRTLMRTNGLDPEKLEELGRLRIVDWFSWRGERIIGVERDGYALKSSKILSNLGIAIGKAIREVKFSNIEIAYIQIISSAVNIFDFPQVYNFILRLRAKFKEEGISAIYLLEKESVGPDDLMKIKEAFDGMIELKRTETASVIEREIVVHSLSGVDFDHRPVGLTVVDGRLTETAPEGPEAPLERTPGSFRSPAYDSGRLEKAENGGPSDGTLQIHGDPKQGRDIILVPPIPHPEKKRKKMDAPESKVKPPGSVIIVPPVKMRPLVRRKVLKGPAKEEAMDEFVLDSNPENMLADAMSTIDELLGDERPKKSSAVRPIRIRRKI
jgi:flagellar protein FlaH